MKFDTVIAGGGLSSLVCGIRLQKAGRKCLIVSAGQNAMHFSSGTFGLLGKLPDGTVVSDPVEEAAKLGDEHPYSKIGAAQLKKYSELVPDFFSSCGVALKGFDGKNGWRLTASGTFKPAWLALKEVPFFASKDELTGSNALIVNFAGFLDFNPQFIAEGLEKRGIKCREEAIKIKEVEALRKNPSEMRSVNIARVMNREESWKQIGHLVQGMLKDEDIVVLPQVFGLGDQVVTDWLQEMISAKVLYVGTMPPSVPGIRTQMQLKKAFESAGGVFQSGDEVLDPEFSADGRVTSVRTVNLGDVRLYADTFVLASGNLFGQGLEAMPKEVREPVFGLDVDFPAERRDWYDEDFFARQAFTGIGVKTDRDFHPFRSGTLVPNLSVTGAELGGHNPLSEESGAGVAIMTALKVADDIASAENKNNRQD